MTVTRIIKTVGQELKRMSGLGAVLVKKGHVEDDVKLKNS